MPISRKRQFQKDFSTQIQDSEANYKRLSALLGDIDTQDSWQFEFEVNQVASILRVNVLERHTYTIDLNLEFDQHLLASGVTTHRFIVRLYTDAKMAEVIEKLSAGQLQSNYKYPNDGMRQPDEKLQRNRFLAEYLAHCLQHMLTINEL